MTPPEHQPFDVAVIGAGPMGSFAAERMAQAGLHVGLFEKDDYPGDTNVCAGGMHHDLVRFLGLPPDLIEKTLPIFRVVINGRASDWRFTEPTYVTVERRRLDVFLAERAVQAGARLLTRAHVVDVVPERAEVYYESGPERVRMMAQATAIIFADGPHSLAHRTLGVQSDLPRNSEYIGVEYDLEAPSNEFDALEIIPDPKTLPFGYIWVFPKRDHINVGLARLGSMEGPPLISLLDRFIGERPDLRGRRELRRKGGVIPARRGPVLQKQNCLVIGDAAGMINPLTGGGYVCGFVSAMLAAETCVEAFRGGRFEPQVLRRYERRLRWTKYYVAIQILEWLLGWMIRAHKRSNRLLYLPFMNLYFHAVHVAMRFVRVI